MSEFIAGAYVDVKPEVANFRASLKRQLDAEVKKAGAFSIPVEIDTAKLRTRINSALKGLVTVTVDPKINRTEFRNSVKAQADKALAGLKVVVPVEASAAAVKAPAGAAAASAAAGTGAAATVAANSAATTSTKKLTEAQRTKLAVTKALKVADEQEAIAQRLLSQAASAGISAEERATNLRQARAASTRGIKAANDLLATSEAKLTKEQRDQLETAVASGAITRVEATEKRKAADIQARQASLIQRSAKTRSDAVVAIKQEVTGIQKLNELHRHENDLTSLDARLKKEANRARDLGLTSTARTNEALRREISGRKEAILLQRAELKGEGVRARNSKTAQRGALSTALSLLGVRGATLAANSAFLAGAAAVAVFAKALGSFAKFETELNTFQAIAGATASQMVEVSKRAKELGADVSLPAVTASDAAQAMTELSRAGLSVRDSLDGARGVLELAAAAQISNAEAATLTASALNAFGLSGDRAVHVADLLANAANAAQGSIAEMGAAMQQASAIARQVGLSLDNTVAILTLFARNGLRGSDAGTSLRTALSRLIAPTKDASQLIESLGINVRDLQGNIRPDVFAQFGVATQNLSPALRDMIAQTIAGQDAIRAFAIGAREGARGLKLAQLQMQQQGAAARVAAARTKGLAGQFSALASNTQTLGTQLGSFAAGPVTVVTTGLNDMLTALNQLASGDFGGFLDETEKDFDQFARNVVRHAGGLKKIAFGDSFKEVAQGVKELVTPAGPDPEQERIQNLIESLERLQSIRVQSFTVGADIGPVTEQIKRIRTELKKAQVDAGLIIPVTKLEKALAPLREAKKAAEDFRKEILAGDENADVGFLDDLIRNFNVRIKVTMKASRKTIKDELSGTDIADSFKAQFKLIAQQPDLATPEVLGGLRDLANKIKGTAPLTGAAGRQIGKTLIAQINAAIKAAVKEDDPDLAADLKGLADKVATLFGASMADAFKGIKLPLTDQQLTDALLPERIKGARAAAFGSVNDQIAAKESELAARQRQLEKVIKGSEQEEAILNEIAAAKGEIRSLRESQAQEQKELDQKSDSRVIDAIGAEERKRQNALIVAQTTESLADDLRREVALRNFYLQQIDQVNATVRDAETRKSQLSDLNQKLFEIDQDITRDRAARRQQIRDQRLKSVDDAAERAQETETLADDQRQANRRVIFWKAQVKAVRKLVRERKATAEELRAALDDLDSAVDAAREVRRNRRKQIRERREERLELRIQIAQDTGNTNAEIEARNAQIKNTQRLIRASRKGSLERLRLVAQLRSEQRELRELKDEQEKANKGTTAFDILKQAAETFGRTGGNLINGDQPFAGPSGFVADIAQWLRSQRSVSSVRGPQPVPSPVRTDRGDRFHFDRLIDALDRNTAAQTGKKNAAANPKGTGLNYNHRQDGRFWDSAEARRMGGV